MLGISGAYAIKLWHSRCQCQGQGTGLTVHHGAEGDEAHQRVFGELLQHLPDRALEALTTMQQMLRRSAQPCLQVSTPAFACIRGTTGPYRSRRNSGKLTCMVHDVASGISRTLRFVTALPLRILTSLGTLRPNQRL